jgi:SAM-dependent methyltransferase
MTTASTTTPPNPAPTTRPAPDAAWRALHRAACAPYRAAGRFAWHFAQGKLGGDPVFRSLLERGDIAPHARVVDIGCGQGLLASLLAAVDQAATAGAWPAAWAPAPTGTRYTGIELMPRDVARAEAAVGGLASAPRLVCGDMRNVELPACDTVVILDVLHYVDHAAQQRVLARVRDALQRGRVDSAAGEGARLLLRVGDAGSRRGFAISQWVDRIVTLVRGHRVPPTFGRPLPEWIGLLDGLGFAVTPLPMSQGTPFANVLLVGTLR